jgi:hypothetical protein
MNSPIRTSAIRLLQHLQLLYLPSELDIDEQIQQVTLYFYCMQYQYHPVIPTGTKASEPSYAHSPSHLMVTNSKISSTHACLSPTLKTHPPKPRKWSTSKMRPAYNTGQFQACWQACIDIIDEPACSLFAEAAARVLAAGLKDVRPNVVDRATDLHIGYNKLEIIMGTPRVPGECPEA